MLADSLAGANENSKKPPTKRSYGANQVCYQNFGTPQSRLKWSGGLCVLPSREQTGIVDDMHDMHFLSFLLAPAVSSPLLSTQTTPTGYIVTCPCFVRSMLTLSSLC